MNNNDNNTYFFSKEELAKINHTTCDSVNCLNCRFSEWSSLDLDRHTISCFYWKQKMLTKSFCNHYTKKVSQVATHADK